MIRPRPSIAGLLGTIALLSVGFAALKVSSRLWASSLVSFALLSLVVAVAGVIYRRGRTRASFAGFALFGWTYFLLALGPPPLNSIKDQLVTTPILAVLEEQLLEAPTPSQRSAPLPSRTPLARTSTAFIELSPWTYWTDTDRSNPFANDSFLRIGHALFSLVIAAVGMIFCRYLYDSRDEPRPEI